MSNGGIDDTRRNVNGEGQNEPVLSPDSRAAIASPQGTLWQLSQSPDAVCVLRERPCPLDSRLRPVNTGELDRHDRRSRVSVDFDSLVDNSRRRVLGHARCQVIHVTVVVVAIEMMSRQLMEPVAIVTLHRVQNMRGGQVNLVLIVMSARRRAAWRGDRWRCH